MSTSGVICDQKRFGGEFTLALLFFLLGELRYTSRSFYKVEVKILGGGYFKPSLCNLLHLAKWKSNLLTMAVLRYPVGTFCSAW